MTKSERFSLVFNTAIRYSKWIIAVLVLIICFSGVKMIDNSEVGIVLRFGRLVGDTREEQVHEPGLMMAFPYIIDEVIKVPVGKVQEVEIVTHASLENPAYEPIEWTGYLISGDENILHIEACLKYRIVDPVMYALYNNSHDKMIEGVVAGVMASTASSEDVDGLLTDKKDDFREKVIAESQKIFDELELGINIIGLEFQNITPPNSLKAKFDQVNAAYVEKETKIQEAKQYREQVVPAAHAEANKLVTDANILQSQRVAGATDNTAEFWGLYKEYEANHDVVRERIFRERVTKIFNKMGGKMVLPEGGTPGIFLP